MSEPVLPFAADQEADALVHNLGSMFTCWLSLESLQEKPTISELGRQYNLLRVVTSNQRLRRNLCLQWDKQAELTEQGLFLRLYEATEISIAPNQMMNILNGTFSVLSINPLSG